MLSCKVEYYGGVKALFLCFSFQRGKCSVRPVSLNNLLRPRRSEVGGHFPYGQESREFFVRVKPTNEVCTHAEGHFIL